MKRYKVILLLFTISVFVLTGFQQNKKNNSPDDDKWSGTVSFFEKRIGPEIVISEWRMDAVFKNNEGTATNKMKSRSTDGAHGECNGLGKSELNVGVDMEAKLYAIEASIPDCSGISFSAAGTELEFVQDGGIWIENQRLGTNPNSLAGTLTRRDSLGNGGLAITTYTWSLKKTN